MSPRPDARAERIPQILAAARAVFARSGFAQTRMEDIAREAGLSKAALYLYFDSKDDVVSALLTQYFAEAFADLETLRQTPGPLRRRLNAWTQRRIAELEADPAFLAIGYEFFAVAARQEAVREVLRGYYHRYQVELARLLAEGRAELSGSRLTPPELATTIVALLEGLTLLWMVDPQGVNLRRATARALNGVLGPPA
jgi:AcrR family transcriptional regulator